MAQAIREYAELSSTREIRFAWIVSNQFPKSGSPGTGRSKVTARLGALIDLSLPGLLNEIQVVLDSDDMAGAKDNDAELATFVAEHPQKLTFSVDSIECTANLTAAGAAQTICDSRVRRLTPDSLSQFLSLEGRGRA